MKKLSTREKLFVSEYLIDKQGGAAARRAGYAVKSSDVRACLLLKKPEVAALLDAEIQKQQRRTNVTADYVILNLKEVVERCMQRAPVMEGAGKDKMQAREWKDGVAQDVWEFDSAGANRALELLGKHLKMFVEQHVLTGPNGKPLMPQVPPIAALKDMTKEELLALVGSGS